MPSTVSTSAAAAARGTPVRVASTDIRGTPPQRTQARTSTAHAEA
jgi:hypothetical protein